MKQILSLLVCFGFVIGLGAIAGCGGDTKDKKPAEKKEEKKEEKKAP